MKTYHRDSFRRALLAGGMLLAGTGASQADYNTGSAAFNAGNYNRAYQEFKPSAESGNSLSQFMIGRLYDEGRGVMEDDVVAYMWYDLSAGNGNSRAIAARDSLAARLDSGQIDRAQDLSAKWRADHAAAGAAPVVPQTYVPAVAPAIQPYSLLNVQAALSSLGYAVGTPDGVIGPKSRAAIRAYQVDSGLPASGEPSLKLHEKLQASLAQRNAPVQPASQPSAASGAAISEAQTELRRRGYTISAITGTANAETVAAIRDYQADARLPVTGEISDALLQQLRSDSADSGAIYRAQVKQVQAALNAAGYVAGPADGALGPKSRAAISRYQSDHNLAATGDVNAELLASLDIAGGSGTTANAVSAATIRQTKEELLAHGYAVDNLNGTLDTATRDAIRAYQSDAGLTVTGDASAGLLDHLRQSNTQYGGDNDNQVALDIENQLQRRGYKVGPVDGVVDPTTRLAIRAYQGDAGLAVTGDADSTLLASLRGSDVQSVPATVVAETQWLLIRLGYLNAASDGVMGPESTSAIRRYQADRNLMVTGRPSQELLAKLRAERIQEPGADNL